MQFLEWSIADDQLEALIRREELARRLVKRSIEEEITGLVDIDGERVEELLQQFREQHNLSDEQQLSTWLKQRQWSEDDLRIHVNRPEALHRFAKQRFGPGLEEHFLQRKAKLDSVLYSLLRVRDPGLAQELWIQISEGEINFADAAGQHSDGPEAASRGLIGPVALGDLQPELSDRLRTLQQGDIRPPERLGPWFVLLRLEKLNHARLDDAMRKRLLKEQMDTWLQARADSLLKGEQPEELHYDSAP